MSIPLMNINPQKNIFHEYDFPVYTASKYRDKMLTDKSPKCGFPPHPKNANLC